MGQSGWRGGCLDGVGEDDLGNFLALKPCLMRNSHMNEGC